MRDESTLTEDIFEVTKATFLMQLLKDYKPDLHDGLQKIALAWDDEKLRQKVLEEIWPDLEKIAIDHAVAEPASMDRRVAVVPATFGQWRRPRCAAGGCNG